MTERPQQAATTTTAKASTARALGCRRRAMASNVKRKAGWDKCKTVPCPGGETRRDATNLETAGWLVYGTIGTSAPMVNPE